MPRPSLLWACGWLLNRMACWCSRWAPRPVCFGSRNRCYVKRQRGIIRPPAFQAMRYLLAAAAVLMASPAFSFPWQGCSWPPGSSDETARWSSEGKIIETYLTTSNGDRYTCGPNVKQNEPSRLAGSTGYFKQVCGPLTIVQKEYYRECTFKESAGFSGYEISKGRCENSRFFHGVEIISDTEYELRDKNGQAFFLGREYGHRAIGESSSESCTSNIKTKIFTKTWRVGASKISLKTVTEYQAENIKQPSL
jgi:hypothetical protein